ncbi:Tetratricopeptide repeat protein 30A [Dirofilaria immitis]
MPFAPIKDGEFTSTIYGMIKEGKYENAIRSLQYELQRMPNSRAALSLLGYCHFYQQEYVEAATYYEQLVQLYPTYAEYRLYWAQSLYNAFMFSEAIAIISQIDEPQLDGQVLKLESAIKYREEDITNARILVEKYAADDPDTDNNLACLEYKEGNYEKALERFTIATNLHGYQPNLAYSIALCHYQMHNYTQAIKFIADIIDRGIQNHPELSIGMATEGMEVSSVGNTRLLHETSLIEACNLKAAIEYNLKNLTAASEALTDMPPRLEEELDSVTLHNQALINMDDNPSDDKFCLDLSLEYFTDAFLGFAKLQYLLSQNPCPPETFSNLLLLYCKYEYYDLAADVLAENADLASKYLTQYLYDYLDAVITQQTAPMDAYNKFEAIGNEQINELRKLTKRLNEIREGNDELIVQKTIKAYDDTMAKYMPVLMSQAKIYWDMNNYTQVEKIFRKSAEFCNDDDIWKLNVAHTLFMQANKFKEAAGFYEPNVKKNFDNMLSITAIILANLSVCYIMTNQNEEAEELMKKVENEEEANAEISTKTKFFHLCIINLVIGTLYCSKGNYEFGISRVIKAMEPYDKKLGTDTWFYSKRCMISLIENLAKHLISIRDSVLFECLQFLEQCEIYGKNVPTTVTGPLLADELEVENAKNTVTYEARLLRALLLEVMNS